MKRSTDFAEWLSPMVVKELRQGLRSRLFVLSFLLLQGAMIFVALLALAASATRQNTSGTTTFFWLIIGVPLLLIMPASGLGSVGNERKANTLELIFLTRLTARRILAGKWLALVAQTALLVCAVLPYAVLRYFLGGVNVGGEVLAILLLLLASAVLSGVAVGLSPQSIRVTRTVLAVAIFFGLQFSLTFLPYIFGGVGGPLSGGPAMAWKSYAGLGMLALLLLLLMLEFGASKIAPPAENHSTSRRLVGFGALALVSLSGALRTAPAVWAGGLALLLPICIGALCERPLLIPSVYRPFVRRGLAGRMAGRLLYPGWPSGVLFTLAVLLILAPITYAQARRTVETGWICWTGIAIAGALLLPAAIIRTFLPKTRHPAVIYFVTQGACALLAALGGAVAGFELVDLRPFIAMIPACGLLLAPSGGFRATDDEFLLLLLGTSLITLASLSLLLMKMRAPWREIRGLEKLDAAESRATA